MTDPISLLILLKPILKGISSGIGSKIGQTFFDKVKELSESSIAEERSKAYLNASNKQLFLDDEIKNELHALEDDEYYSQLIYGFDLINGEELSSYHKDMSKLFLLEIFKDEKLKAELFNAKIDSIKQDTIKTKLNTEILKARLISVLKEYSHYQFLTESDFENFPNHYIPRKIILDRDWFSENKISSFIELFTYCKSCQQNKFAPIRALIIADGGIGKSVYLQQLSKECADSKRFYPVYISLRDLTASDVAKDYIERRYPELAKIDYLEYDQLFLFLDGFDEVGDSASAVKQIGDLCRTYPETHIVLTSRRNSFSNQLPDFYESFIFTLAGITREDIESYILTEYKSCKIDTEHFFKEVEDNGFINLLFSPFYLRVLVDCYIQNNNRLVISKKELIDNLITERRQKDKEKRPDLNFEKAPIQLKIKQLGAKFAFTQALMNQRNLSEDDTAKLFDDDFDLAIYSLPIRKGSLIEGKQQWEFEHNIFLEHLVSETLREMDIDEVLDYATSNNKVKSKWKDIITHLLGILDNRNNQEKKLYNNLINWLIENNPEVLLNVEESHLDQDVRSKIFVDIYKTKQEKTTWIDRNKINLQQMALFGETKENVQLLFNDIINTNNHFRQRINASLIFQHFKLNSLSRIEIEKMSQEYADSICSLPIECNDDERTLTYHLIDYFPFNNEAAIDLIMKYWGTTSSSYIISSLIHLIRKNNLEDKYVNRLITWRKQIESKETSNDFSIRTSLNLAFCKMMQPASYIAFYQSLLDSNLYYDFRSYEKEELHSIIKKSINYFESRTLEIIIQVVSKHISWYSLQDWKLFDPIFQDEKIRIEAIKLILKSLEHEEHEDIRHWQYVSTLAQLIEQSDLPLIFNTVTKEDLLITLTNRTIKESVKADLLQYVKDKYNYIPIKHVDPWLERARIEFNILFDKQRFVIECLSIFDELKSDTINYEELKEEKIGGKYRNRSLTYFLYWFKGGKNIKKSDVQEWFKNQPEYFDYYLNSQICGRIPDPIKKEKNKELTTYQIKVLKEYYDKYILTTDFTTKIDKEDRKTYTYAKHSPILITYMKKLNFDCPDNKLCEMIGNLWCEFDFITNKVKDKVLLKKTIFQNLHNYKEFGDSRTFQQCKYAISHDIANIDNIILEIIKDSEFEEYHKTELITLCIKHNKLTYNILNLTHFLNQSQILKICNQLIEKNYSNKDDIHSLLYQIIEESFDDKTKLAAITLLISQQETKALKLLIEYSKEHNTIALHDRFNNNYIDDINIGENYLQYDDISILPLLIELLELSLRPTITQKNGGRNKIESSLTHLALLSEDNYIEIIMTLEQFIQDNKTRYTDVESINFIIEHINDLHQEKQSKQYSFKEAKIISNNIIE